MIGVEEGGWPAPAQGWGRFVHDRRGGSLHFPPVIDYESTDCCCLYACYGPHMCMEGTMPKHGKMFAGITRQVVISDETHQLLRAAAQRENKYIGELADEILRRALTRQSGDPNVGDHGG